MQRRRRFFVSSSTDLVYTPLRGLAFAPGSADVIADAQPLSFTVTDDGLEFFERYGRETWTQMLERRAARRLAVAKPRRRRAAA